MTAVATRPVQIPANQITQIIGDRVQDLGRSAYRGFTPDAVIEAAMHAAVTNPKILECTPESVFLALGKVARWGLHIGDEVHLVPYFTNGKLVCTAIVDYKGLKALAYRQKLCRLIQEYPIYAGDHFEIEDGIPGRVSHRRTVPDQRGKLVGAWCSITLPGGLSAWNHMFIEDIEAIRETSKQWNPKKYPECPPWYAMKTVVRNWLNKQPKGGSADSSALSEAIQADDADFEIVHPDATAQPSGQALGQDLNAVLPGTSANFGGWGGKPIVDAPKEQLEAFATWCHSDGRRAEKHRAALGLAEDRLVEMREAAMRAETLKSTEDFPA